MVFNTWKHINFTHKQCIFYILLCLLTTWGYVIISLTRKQTNFSEYTEVKANKESTLLGHKTNFMHNSIALTLEGDKSSLILFIRAHVKLKWHHMFYSFSQNC